jgi:curved DNA-binding protein CbpA
MADRGRDPYRTLGVDPSAPEAELRAAYRRLVQRHHPDHNGGSVESARRFEEVQEAYAQIRVMRAAATGAGSRAASRPGSGPAPAADPAVDSRLADLERELREAQRAREQAREQAREAARRATADQAENARPAAGAARAADRARPGRPSDEELGYINTDDSFAKILSDAASELSGRLAEAGREHELPRRLADLIEELGSKLTGDPPGH